MPWHCLLLPTALSGDQCHIVQTLGLGVNRCLSPTSRSVTTNLSRQCFFHYRCLTRAITLLLFPSCICSRFTLVWKRALWFCINMSTACADATCPYDAVCTLCTVPHVILRCKEQSMHGTACALTRRCGRPNSPSNAPLHATCVRTYFLYNMRCTVCSALWYCCGTKRVFFFFS